MSGRAEDVADVVEDDTTARFTPRSSHPGLSHQAESPLKLTRMAVGQVTVRATEQQMAALMQAKATKDGSWENACKIELIADQDNRVGAPGVIRLMS